MEFGPLLEEEGSYLNLGRFPQWQSVASNGHTHEIMQREEKIMWVTLGADHLESLKCLEVQLSDFAGLGTAGRKVAFALTSETGTPCFLRS